MYAGRQDLYVCVCVCVCARVGLCGGGVCVWLCALVCAWKCDKPEGGRCFWPFHCNDLHGARKEKERKKRNDNLMRVSLSTFWTMNDNDDDYAHTHTHTHSHTRSCVNHRDGDGEIFLDPHISPARGHWQWRIAWGGLATHANNLSRCIKLTMLLYRFEHLIPPNLHAQAPNIF